MKISYFIAWSKGDKMSREYHLSNAVANLKYTGMFLSISIVFLKNKYLD